MASYPCLLFLVPKVTAKNPKEIIQYFSKNNVKGFVLLPSLAVKKCPQIVSLFARNNIEILNNNQLCQYFQRSLECDQVEAVELIVTDLNQTAQGSNSLPFYRVLVETGNDEVVRSLFRCGEIGCTVCKNQDFGTGFKVIDSNNSETLECILRCNADISYRNILGGTLLHHAVLQKNEKLIKLLLEHNANVDARTNYSATPLHLAAKVGNPTIVSSLLRKGASINARAKHGETSLFQATEHRQWKVVSLLLKNEADVTIGNDDGLTPLHLAALSSVEIVKKFLKRGAIIDAKMTYCGTENITPLCLAVEKEESETVKLLLKHGADVNALCYDDQTVLRVAVDNENIKIVRFILDHHPDLNNEMNKQALNESMLRVGKISCKIADMLVQYGFTVNTQDVNDSKLFHQAICKNYVKIVKQLLDDGADVNKLYRYLEDEKHFRQTTPLITAIRFSKEDVIQLLVEHGADVNAKLYLDGVTPVDEAVKNGNLEAVKILIANNADFLHDNGDEESEKIFDFAIGSECLSLVEELLNKGVNISGNSLQSLTPICQAAEHSSLEIVKLLLKSGASLDSRDKYGGTALHNTTCLADEKVRLNVLKYLVQNNADIEARLFSTSYTPISLSVTAGRLKMVDALLKYGAIIDCIDSRGGSPLHYAVTDGRIKIFRALLDYHFNNAELIKKTNICNLFNKSYIRNLRNKYKYRWIYDSFDRNRKIFKKSAEILARHVIKTKAAFPKCHFQENLMESDDEILRTLLSVRNSLPAWYRNENMRNDFLKDCKAEIAQLKTECVGATSVTYYDVLTKNVKQLACYARNTNFVQTVNSKDYKNKFPIYSSVLFYQLRKGTQRRSLLNRALRSFHLLFRHFKKLPLHLKENMLNYLNNKDLEILIYTCTQKPELH